MIGAVEYALPAIEIVDSRVADWNIRIVDTIADNASSGRYVLGTEPRRLARVRSPAVRHGDREQGRAGLASAPAPPASAIRWSRCCGWRAPWPRSGGRCVPAMSCCPGPLGPMVAARPGDVFEARINRLGSVRAAFAPRGECNDTGQRSRSSAPATSAPT